MNASHARRTFDRFARPPWPEAAVLLVAAAVRFWRLDYHSIWFDEAISLKWAGSDASYIWQVTFPLIQDKHPPLFYLLLHYWQQALRPFGLATNDAALRALGSFLGILTVAGVMLLATRLGSRRTGLLAGVLVAPAPLLVWYSQELRMFQPATTAVVWSAVGLFLAWQNSGQRRRYLWWLVFTAGLLAAFYTYLFSAFMLPAAGLTVLLVALARRSIRFFVEGSVALAAVTAAFLPLARNAWLVNASDSTPGSAFTDFVANTTRLVQNFSIWRVPWSDALIGVAVAAFGVLALAGLVLPYAREIRRNFVGGLDLDQLWLVVWLVTPLLVANLMLSRSSSIFDEDRYLLFVAPFFLWALARGVVAVASRSRLFGGAAALIAVVPLLLALPALWTPTMARENWRAAAGYILEYSNASPSLPDAVIAHVDYTHEPLEWYLRQNAGFDELPVFFPFGGTLQPKDVSDVIAPPLLGLVEFGTHTAWLAQSHLEGVDDERLVERWFADNFPIVTELYPAGIKLSAYMLRYRYPELPDLHERAVYPEAELVPGLVLAACEVIDPSVKAVDDELHPPSGWVHVRLWWRADDDIDRDYQTTAQVAGQEGIWGDRLYREGELMQHWPASAWLPGEYVREELDVNLNPLTPPGTYPLIVGLVDQETGQASPTVPCGEVEVR